MSFWLKLLLGVVLVCGLILLVCVWAGWYVLREMYREEEDNDVRVWDFPKK